MSAVEIRVERKVYPQSETVALEAMTLRIERGQFLALVGPSGAGKTSLLNIIAGLDDSFDGEVAVAPDAARVSMVFQTPRLMPWLSVTDNIRLVLGRDADSSALTALLHDLELDGFEDAFPGQLSGGMQRRVSLARAFAVDPQLLLMDEPFLSLDEPLAWRLREQLMAMWSKRRPTVLYVTHDLEEALSLAQRVVFMSARPGRVVLDQPVDLPHPRAAGDPCVAELKRDLLARHPRLLSGLAHAGNGSAPDASSTSQWSSGSSQAALAE